jgi:hypothetical protein
MKNRPYITTVLILFVYCSCSAQKITSIQSKIPEGKWVSAQDSLDVVIVKGEYTFQYYNNVLKDSAKYFFSKNPCNTSYKPSKKSSTFLLMYQEHLCFEVEGITHEYMELTYTVNGRTLTYWRQH